MALDIETDRVVSVIVCNDWLGRFGKNIIYKNDDKFYDNLLKMAHEKGCFMDHFKIFMLLEKISGDQKEILKKNGKFIAKPGSNDIEQLYLNYKRK